MPQFNDYAHWLAFSGLATWRTLREAQWQDAWTKACKRKERWWPLINWGMRQCPALFPTS